MQEYPSVIIRFVLVGLSCVLLANCSSQVGSTKYASKSFPPAFRGVPSGTDYDGTVRIAGPGTSRADISDFRMAIREDKRLAEESDRKAKDAFASQRGLDRPVRSSIRSEN